MPLPWETTTGDTQVNVTPDDDERLDLRYLWVGTTGDLVIQDKYGTTSTYAGVAAGTQFSGLQIAKVMAATTAGNLIGWR